MKDYKRIGGVLAACLALLIVVLAATVPLKFAVLQTDMNGGGFCITNLSCLNVGTATISNLNLVGGFVRQITSVNQTVTVNPTTNADTSIVVDLGVNLSGITNVVVNSISLTNSVSLKDGFLMTPAISTANSNSYWWDWGKTNILGQSEIYASLSATNDVVFLGPTNLKRWMPLSFDVIANGANRNLSFSTNTTFLNLTGFTTNGPYYTLILSNGNLFRITIQSNIALEPTWLTHGQ